MTLHSPLAAGWYATRTPGTSGAGREISYLFFVPEIGPFLLLEDGSVRELPSRASRWEWHGPFASHEEARTVDLEHDPSRSATQDVWAV